MPTATTACDEMRARNSAPAQRPPRPLRVSRTARALTRTAQDVLHFAAAPTFALLAIAAMWSGSAMPDAVCSASTSPIHGMAMMYGLMSTFHLTPWLKLIAS